MSAPGPGIFRHISSTLMDEVIGEYDIAGSIPPYIANMHPGEEKDKATYTHLRERIGAIILAVEFIDTVGWYEHTSDWDLRWGVSLKDGTAYGELQTEPHPESDEYQDCIAVEFASQLRYEKAQLNQTPFTRKPLIPQFQLFTHIRLTLNDYDEDGGMTDSTVDVHINQIDKISITRL